MKPSFKNVPALLVVFSILLTGCGGVTTAAPEATKPPAAEQATEIPTEALAADPVTLVVWSMYTEGETMQIWEAAAIQAFEATHPNVKIDVTWQGRDVVSVKLRNAILSNGDLPDIIDNSNPGLVIGLLSEDMALPLDDYLETPSADGTTPWGETFIPSVMEFLKYNGNSYMIPRMVYSSGFFYNIRIFADNNITIPETWGEFLAVCQQLKDAGITPILADNEGQYTIWPYTMSALRTAGPTGLYDTIADKTGEKWNDPALLEAAKMVQQMSDYYQDGYLGSIWPAAQLEFVQERGAMMFMGAWLPSEMLKDIPEGFEMDIFPFPNTGGPGDNVNEAWTNSWAVLKGSKQPDTAVEFLKFLTSAEQMQGVLDAGAPVPLVGFPMPESLQGLSKILGAKQLVPRQSGIEQDFANLYFEVLEPGPYAPLWQLKGTPEDFIPAAMEAQVKFYQANP